jgi:hypothetical protein
MKKEVMEQRSVSTFNIWKHGKNKNFYAAVNLCNMEEMAGLHHKSLILWSTALLLWNPKLPETLKTKPAS